MFAALPTPLGVRVQKFPVLCHHIFRNKDRISSIALKDMMWIGFSRIAQRVSMTF